MAPKLSLSFQSRGLVVTGDTYHLRTLFKELEGRWDASQKAWVFPHHFKAELLKALKRSPDGVDASIQDAAKLKLKVGTCEDGLLVSGETFPLKEFLKEELRGTWNPSSRGWLVKDKKKASLLSTLRRHADVAEVEDDTEALALVAKAPSSSAGPGGALRPVATPQRKGGRELEVKGAASGKLKVTEAVKRKRSTEHAADGSRKAATEAESKQRRITCKKTGRHVQTESVSKKKKVTETKGKIVEVHTVTVKRVRSKR
eukprot:TRINITY_DN10998_c0_g1_i1.p1 TRINITY_DN10998_c0_g1~~TRINITY_DN10998_c0_g1_i1.p1  ORF type:complete len:258 (+),score=83.94 TRINITY_DN10998_c0_g1_i1:109-882(+)